MNIALTYNMIRKKILKNRPVDAIAELDSKETIDALKDAIEKNGHDVVLVEADEEAYLKLKNLKNKIDLVFNIAEGISGESRESYIPFMCEMLGIPYTGSSPSALAICLNKARTKEILMHYNIATPKFQIFNGENEKLNENITYPLILKLKDEGSKMGLTKSSVVRNDAELKKQLTYLFETYNKPVMAEEFLIGREFTVGVIGNDDPITFPPVEVKFSEQLKETERVVLFQADDPVVSMIKSVDKNFSNSEKYVDYASVCPAGISKELESRLKETALKAYRTLRCRDWCRIDMRLDKNGKVNVLELNPIAGIDPSYWFPRAAKAAGMEYHQLIGKIIDYASERYKIKRAVMAE
ncbi:MAG: D-alanine--D-alanine ligase [Candidatus Woesearchaeota archaeon]|nr:D-alanine--D-alanine ligase [Candidatus Woesearchaeota archaeon]